MKGSVARALSEEAKIVFAEGIGLLLIRWTALQAAVENEWGGRDSRRKAELIVSEIFTWFTQSPGYVDSIHSSTHLHPFFSFGCKNFLWKFCVFFGRIRCRYNCEKLVLSSLMIILNCVNLGILQNSVFTRFT